MVKYYKIIYNILRSFALPIFSFTLSILGIRLFGKQNWGEFIYVITIINFFAFVGNFGNKDFLLRKYSANPAKINSFFISSFSSRLVLLALSLTVFIFIPFKTALLSILLITLIFICQSFDSLIIFYQKFLQQLVAELLGFIIIIALILYDLNFTLANLLYVYIIAYTFKAVFLIVLFWNEIQFEKPTFSLNELKQSLPFFLIIFSGWIASKIDLYIVNFKLPKEQIAEYQLGITAFLLLQSLSYLIILPFNKHIYRLQLKVIKKIKLKLAYIAIPIVIFCTFCIWVILEKITYLNLPLAFYLFGGLASVPTFFFMIDILLFYKNKKENIILKINLISAFINLILTYNLIEYYGITGAILSVLITQYIILMFYKFNFIK